LTTGFVSAAPLVSAREQSTLKSQPVTTVLFRRSKIKHPTFGKGSLRPFQLYGALGYGVTVKTALLVDLPPGVVTAILPVLAPVGTLIVNCWSEFTE
jgi:hypothetical protein